MNILLTTIVFFTISSQSSCLQETEHKGQKYLIFDTERVDWRTAEKNCKRQFNGRGKLVTIDNEEENTFIRNALQEESLWLGAKVYRNAQWKWLNKCLVDDGYTNWSSGQPSNSRRNKDCLAMPWNSDDGEWKDYDCSRQFSYACEDGLENHCINHEGRAYVVAGDAVSSAQEWTSAEKICSRQFGGKGELATISNTAENDFIREEFPDEDVWIGGKMDAENRWKWPSQCSVSDDYTNWESGEPDDFETSNHCMAISSDSENGQWTDLECSKQLRYVCEQRKEVRCAFHKRQKYILYSYGESRKDWSKAVDTCSWQFGYNGQLVTVDDEDENSYIRDELNENSFWLSGKFDGGKWKWSNNCPVDEGFTNWGAAGSNTNGGNCLGMSGDAADGEWTDFQCSRQLNFACEEKGKKNCAFHNGRTYVIANRKDDWLTARDYCAKEFDGNGQLVTIDNEEENYFISDAVKDETFSYTSIWLGGSDQDEEGVWKWQSGCPRTIGVRSTDSEITNTGFSTWVSGEPNNVNIENCMIIPTWSYSCNDISCSNKFFYACEQRAKDTCEE